MPIDWKVVDIDELDFGFPINEKAALPDVSNFGNNSSVQQEATAKRRNLVFDLKVQGYEYKEIAEIITKKYKEDPSLNYQNLPKNYNDNQVGNDVRREVGKYVENKIENVEKYIVIEIRRIEKMINSLWERATKLDGKDAELTAIDRIISLQKRKASLLGLDAPEKVDILKKSQEEDAYSGFSWADPNEIPEEIEITEEEINNRVKKITDGEGNG